MSYRMIVFGSLPIATKVAEWIRAQEGYELVGVVLTKRPPHNNDPWPGVPCLREYAESSAVRVFELDELPSLFSAGELDLGLTCRFGRILKRGAIDVFRLGVINMHGGLLPEFGGLYSCNHMVLRGSPVGGGTLHFVDEGIDTGDIIRRCEFPIGADDTGYSVFQKTQVALYENMIEVIPKVLAGEAEATPIGRLIEEGHAHAYFDAHSIEGEKEVDFSRMGEEEILRRVRAFDFPGYEPAYAVVGGRKVYLRTCSDVR